MADQIQPVYGGMFDSTEVVETVGGFPRGNKAVDAAFFARMIACFYRDGIWGADSFAVTPGGGYTVRISPGIAWIHGYMAWQKEASTLTLRAGAAFLILLRLNIPAGEFSLVATEGGAVHTDSIQDLTLCEITVPGGQPSVTADMLTDTRSDRQKCGHVTGAADVLGLVEAAENAHMLGGKPASAYLTRQGGTMTGALLAAADTTGRQIVRNIGYGTVLPDALADGDLFVLLSQ